MDEVAEQPNERQPRRWRIRFGLKTLFLVLTLLCLWIGYEAARLRQADRMIARHQAVVDAIIANIVTAPQRTMYQMPVASPQVLNGTLRFPGYQNARNARTTVLGTSSLATQGHVSLDLDISKLGKDTKRSDITKRLVQHYGRGLDQAGLNGVYGSYDGYQSREILASPQNELIVVIDANLVSDEQTAHIRILFIDSQQLHLW